LVAFDDTSSAEIAMHVEVKTVPASTQHFVQNTTAAITIDRVRRKQSTVLLVVIYHVAGLDFFVRPTADLTASHGKQGSRCCQNLSASTDAEESALIGVLHKMLRHYRDFAAQVTRKQKAEATASILLAFTGSIWRLRRRAEKP
jgi:hypothetical protein